MSDNLRVWAWRTADRRGLWSTAFRTAFTFSGVLTIRLDTPCFFVAEAVVRKLCTQRSIVFRGRILLWRTLKCRRNFLCVTITDSPFLKNVSMMNARCWGLHCSMATKTAKPYAFNDSPTMATVRSAFIYKAFKRRQVRLADPVYNESTADWEVCWFAEQHGFRGNSTLLTGRHL